ncbi:MAG: hypothetical protein FD123_102 [Bacteroidetes bacterium]|nr:MAG: hypothetical protein FD123_102 [Bacteroidota bacterium]
MQQKKLRIAVPEPCHERWDQMTATEKGAFCKSCAKEVRDFTRMTNEEVAYFLKHNQNEKTCGRFRNEQLQQTYSLPVTAPLAPRRTWLNLLLLVPLTLLGKTAFGQHKPPVCERPADYDKRQTDTSKVKEEIPGDEILEMITAGNVSVSIVPVALPPQIWQGRVINATTKAALPLAQISIHQGNFSREVSADSTGLFALPLPAEKGIDSLTVSLAGFAEKKIAFSETDSTALPAVIELNPLTVSFENFVWSFGEGDTVYPAVNICTTLGEMVIVQDMVGQMIVLEVDTQVEDINVDTSNPPAEEYADFKNGIEKSSNLSVPAEQKKPEPEKQNPEPGKQAVMPDNPNNTRRKK